MDGLAKRPVSKGWCKGKVGSTVLCPYWSQEGVGE